MLPVQNLQPRENEILRRNARTETHVRIVDRSRNYREGTPGSEEQRLAQLWEIRKESPRKYQEMIPWKSLSVSKDREAAGHGEAMGKRPVTASSEHLCAGLKVN